MTKMCTEAGVEDCKTANKIKYCYCKGDLCNREIVPVETPVSLETNEMPSSEAEDDEDSAMEGSGFLKKAGSRQVELGIEIIRKQTPTTTKSVILTTSRPDDAESKNSSVSICPRPMNFFYLISFLLVLRFF